MEHALFEVDDSYASAKQRAREVSDFGYMFTAGQIDFDDYPVAHTMVEMLVREDPEKFQGLINRVKDGEDVEAALQAEYGVNYAGLEAEWRRRMGQKR